MTKKLPLKRHWIAKEDSPFLIILIISALIHFSTAVYLNTIEIKKKDLGEAIRAIPQRFASLILQPPPAVLKKAKLPVPQKKEEVKEEQRVARKEVETPGIPGTLPERAAKAAGVRQKGLLGVIMAKAGPREIPTAVVFRDIDKVMKDIKKEEPEDRVKDVLSRLHVKEMEKMEVSIGISMPVEPQPLDTGEIVKGRKEILLEDVGKRKVVTKSVTIKKYETDVYAAILSYAGGLKYLYNNALREDPSLGGRVTVRMVISPAGRAKEVIIVSTTLNSPKLEEAIVNRVYMWRFPQFRWGESFTITYTFDFSIG